MVTARSVQPGDFGNPGHGSLHARTATRSPQMGVTFAPHNYTRPVKINGAETTALVDSGSAITLILGKLVKSSQLLQAKRVAVTCVHGAVSHYPTIPVEIEVQGNPIEVTVGVVPKLPYPVVIGRDYPGFDNLLPPERLEGSGDPDGSDSSLGECQPPMFAEISQDLFSAPQKARKTKKEEGCEGLENPDPDPGPEDRPSKQRDTSCHQRNYHHGR
nr:uncharacterized protein LOC122172154 [Chrysemys picta bellii]